MRKLLAILITSVCSAAIIPNTNPILIYPYPGLDLLGIEIYNTASTVTEPQSYLTIALFGEQASLEVIGTSLSYIPTGGRYGQGYITGYDLKTDKFYSITLGTFDAWRYPEKYPVQNYSGLELVNVPEPAIVCLFGLSGFFIRKVR